MHEIHEVPLFNNPNKSHNPPHPFALVAAMRSMGYTTPTALADLVDNSITAGAKRIAIRIAPPQNNRNLGYVSVEDDGSGMTSEKLFQAMRWGGDGPNRERKSDDLGRFGLGLKTASLSMGRVLTVATRPQSGTELHIFRWDLAHVEKAGWELLEGADPQSISAINESSLADPKRCGTIVVVTQLDRLSIRSGQVVHSERNEADLIRRAVQHLGLVFHRFIEKGVKIRFGSTDIASWDPLAGGDLKGREQLGEGVTVSSYVLPHHTKITHEKNERLAGPLGWAAHQGFLVYRADRLIVPGGWLRLFPTEEACRLARIKIDLQNSVDEGWGLNVIKSSVVPPSWLVAELKRIGEATRRDARAVFSFRGERQAPREIFEDPNTPRAFWNQISTEETVRFRINRAHPIIQALKQNLKEPSAAEQFLKIFERLLPLDAILQDPRRTTNGAFSELSDQDVKDLVALVNKALRVLIAQGHDHTTAMNVILSAEPFSFYRSQIDTHLK